MTSDADDHHRGGLLEPKTPRASSNPAPKPFETLTPHEIAEGVRFVDAMIEIERRLGLGKFAPIHPPHERPPARPEPLPPEMEAWVEAQVAKIKAMQDDK